MGVRSSMSIVRENCPTYRGRRRQSKINQSLIVFIVNHFIRKAMGPDMLSLLRCSRHEGIVPYSTDATTHERLNIPKHRAPFLQSPSNDQEVGTYLHFYLFCLMRGGTEPPGLSIDQYDPF